MLWMTREGFYIDSRHYNDITQQTINRSRAERANRKSLEAHLMLGGWRFFDINNEINLIGSSTAACRTTPSC